ncbi:fasciclin domain-containing protein [Pontibacter sp. E15-1]|uniref:fasciclin domain-containing protein n=1 Tax=Pontibacter sp. E15-1 TaxID=2919918 RepID=UPI001F4F26BF|nr:fasciclin domain-containing protein [Pontibacter sp. E15-1]MCJ8165851.1 fasciclin domain-containing protein [Pontibacter sp. E15-1]
MKKKSILPVALSAALLFGCASSNDTMNDATATDEMTMSETQTMAGSTTDDDASATMPMNDMSSHDMSAHMDLSMENPVDVNDMFEDVSDSKQYDILTLAKKTPNLSTFVALVEHAGLKDDLMRVGEMTVFAPTNVAFAKLDKQKLEMLTEPGNKAQLMNILQAHVLPSKVSSVQFNSSQRIKLTEDSYLPVSVGMNGTSITVGGATIVKNNIEASNGYIHVVDNVIMPSKVSAE